MILINYCKHYSVKLHHHNEPKKCSLPLDSMCRLNNITPLVSSPVLYGPRLFVRLLSSCSDLPKQRILGESTFTCSNKNNSLHPLLQNHWTYRPVYTLFFCSCFLRLHFTLQRRPKVYTFCFPFLLSLNWSVTCASQTEIEQVLIGLLAGLQCITPSLHVLLLQLYTKAAAKAERVNWLYVIIANVTKKIG